MNFDKINATMHVRPLVGFLLTNVDEINFQNALTNQWNILYKQCVFNFNFCLFIVNRYCKNLKIAIYEIVFNE